MNFVIYSIIEYEIQINLVNEVREYALFVFHVMELSKFAGSSTLLGFPTLHSGPNHLSSLLHHEFGKKQIVKRSY